MSGEISLSEAREIAIKASLEYPESYTAVKDFSPHAWVIVAVQNASSTWYDRAVEERLKRVKLETPYTGKFKIGDRVTKKSGSMWTGLIVGTYSTQLTPEGYAVESETEHGSVQIYPVAALLALPRQ